MPIQKLYQFKNHANQKSCQFKNHANSKIIPIKNHTNEIEFQFFLRGSLARRNWLFQFHSTIILQFCTILRDRASNPFGIGSFITSETKLDPLFPSIFLIYRPFYAIITGKHAFFPWYELFPFSSKVL